MGKRKQLLLFIGLWMGKIDVEWVSFHATSSNTRQHIMENWHKLWNLLQNQTVLQIGPNRTSVMAYAELFWLRRRWRNMKKIFPKVLVLTTTMDWMTRKENTMKKTTKPTILPQKQALLQKRKGRFRPFDSCVLKLMEIFLISLQCVVLKFLLFVVVITCFGCFSLLLLSASDVVSARVSSTEVLWMLFVVVIRCFGCCIS